MLKPFMRPVKGEGSYTPGKAEAARAHSVFNTYVHDRLVDNLGLMVPERLTPPHIDATLSLLLDDGEVGVIGEPDKTDSRGHWVYLMAGDLIVRYLGINPERELWRIDLTIDQAVALDRSLRIAHAIPELLEARTAILADAIVRGALPYAVVGEEETRGLADYLDTGRPFAPGQA